MNFLFDLLFAEVTVGFLLFLNILLAGAGLALRRSPEEGGPGGEEEVLGVLLQAAVQWELRWIQSGPAESDESGQPGKQPVLHTATDWLHLRQESFSSITEYSPMCYSYP